MAAAVYCDACRAPDSQPCPVCELAFYCSDECRERDHPECRRRDTEELHELAESFRDFCLGARGSYEDSDVGEWLKTTVKKNNSARWRWKRSMSE